MFIYILIFYIYIFPVVLKVVEAMKELWEIIYIYMHANPPPPRTTAGCRDTVANPPTCGLLVYDPIPRGEHMYDGSRLHVQFVATLHVDTPRDDKR